MKTAIQKQKISSNDNKKNTEDIKTYSKKYINLQQINIDDNAVKAVSAKIATFYNIMPVKIVGQNLTIAVSKPITDKLYSELMVILKNRYKITTLLTSSSDIEKAVRDHYGLGADTVEKMVVNNNFSNKDSINAHNINDEKMANDASVMKFVNQIIADAINAKATDIHIEPFDQDLQVRFRVDGMLYNAGLPDTARHFKDGIISRIKIMAGMDIAEKRLPQDGRTEVNFADNSYDLRISILPTKHGQAANIRILPKIAVISNFTTLGFEEDIINKLNRLIKKPYGIILVTGPTGSGKTTTLYTSINQLNKTSRKIITIEDPVEYNLKGVMQMQVHSSIGFTFASALRSMLRHDPDIMLIGEIRDTQTAETAIRTALTGHLVFSTLHTNTAASAIARLLDMGIEPYLAASSIEAILAQRLIRKLCPYCKEKASADLDLVRTIKKIADIDHLPVSAKAVGCPKCKFTGYQGRTVITELIIISETIREMIIKKCHTGQIHTQALKEGTVPLLQSGLKKAFKTITSYEEILNIIGQV